MDPGSLVFPNKDWNFPNRWALQLAEFHCPLVAAHNLEEVEHKEKGGGCRKGL